jgi:eukaryotic-like serine/threonine-protein kinase
MSLASGVRLGPYEILGSLGAGGMGEVYKARDVRLDRLVAIKVLPAALAADADLRQRLEREARAVAALQHPHICTLHDVGHQDGIDFLVMEYIEGQTLAEHLRKGAFPVERTIQYALQIADALAQAHRGGIVHRDLKPGNIMVTPSGIKLLDFGLAKLLPQLAVGGFGSGVTETGPLTAPLTGAGRILGTLAYMSPEQIEGRNVDHRADIWAFGCVVYEMTTGCKTFSKQSDAGTIAAILEHQPEPLSKRQPLTPLALDRLVSRCLAKDPEDRYQSARDAFLELRGTGSADVPRPLARRAAWRPAAAGAIAALLVATGGFAVWSSNRDAPRSDAPLLRLSIALGPEPGFPEMPAISPDGRHVAFSAVSTDGIQRLWIWSTESARSQAVDATDGAELPFWSPDSRQVAFFAGGKLKRVEVNGRAPQVLADAPSGAGGSWNRNGEIIFAPDGAGRLHRVLAAGGSSTPLTTIGPGAGVATHRRPWFLPDGDHFLFLAQEPGQVASTVHVATLSEPDRPSRLLSADSEVAYSSGFLIYARGPRLLAHPFDVERLQTTGEPFSIAENLPFQTDRGAYSAFSVSSNGIVCYSTDAAARRQFVWFDRSGGLQRRVGPAGLYRDFHMSPDGHRLVVARYDPDRGLNTLWLMDVERGTLSRFTTESRSYVDPVWSGNGRRIAFSAREKLYFDIHQQGIEANAREEVLLASEASKYVEDWSRDGRFILYGTGSSAAGKAGHDLWILPTFGSRQPRPFLESRFIKDEPRFSPDGQWVAYNSNETGRWEVYVTSFPDAQQKFPVSTTGGIQPQWRVDGRELFYLGLDGTMLSTTVDVSRGFSAGAPTALFSTGLQRNPGTGQYAVSPNGQRFLLRTDVADDKSQRFAILLNWQRMAKD